MPVYCACGYDKYRMSQSKGYFGSHLLSANTLLDIFIWMTCGAVGREGGREGEGREISLRTRPRPALGAGHQAPRQVVLNCPKMGPASKKEMFNKLHT